MNLIIDQWNLLEKITLRQNVLHLPRINQKELTALRSDILTLKRALHDLGWKELMFTSSQIKRTRSLLAKESTEQKKNVELEKSVNELKKNETAVLIVQNSPALEKDSKKNQSKGKKKAKALNQEIIDQ